MKRFFLMFWNDSSIAERVTRVLLMAVGAGLVAAPESSPTLKMIGAGAAAAALAINAGEKNPPAA